MNESKLEFVVCNYCGADDYRTRYVKDGYNIVQCLNCGLVYVNPRLTQSSIFDLYDEEYFHGGGFDGSVEYEEEFFAKAHSVDLIDWDIAALNELTGTAQHQKRMLDIGCGMGLFLYKSKLADFDVEGIELSEYAAKFAESKGVKIIGGSIENAPTGENKYDVIVMREVIEHLSDPKSALERIYKALKKNGILFITTGNYSCPERKLRGGNWFYFMPEGHIYIFSNKSLKNFLNETGFRNVSVTNQGDLLMNFAMRRGIIEYNRFKPKNPLRRVLFESIRAVNHFISSGLRVYAVK